MLRLLRSSGASDRPSARDPSRPGSSTKPTADPLGHLAKLAREGDTGAQRTLLVSLGPALLKVIRGVLGATNPDVEDALQEAMVAVHLALPGFRGECTTVHFACRIAIQTALNARRRAGYRLRWTPSHAPEELATLAFDDRSPADLAAAAQRREGLRRLVSELPAPQAEALTLHTVLGYTIEETAAVAAAPVNTVRSRLRNALAKLRLRIESDDSLGEAIGGKP